MKFSTSFVIASFFVLIINVGCSESKEMKKAKEYMEASMYEQAITLLEIEIQDNPKNAEANYLLGKCYIQTSNQNKVEECFNRAILLDTDLKIDIGNIYFDKALQLYKGDDFRHAYNYYEEGIRFNPSYQDDFVNQLFDYINDFSESTTDTYKSISIYTIILQISPSYSSKIAEKTFNLAKSFIEKGFIEEGFSYADFGINYDSEHIKDVAELYFNYANDILSIQKKPIESIFYFEKSMVLNPNLKMEISNIYYNQAKIFETNNEISLAILFAEKSVEINPDLNSWYLALKEKYKPKIPTDGLVSYYPFDGNPNDMQGIHNGSVSGAELTNGKSGNGYYFSAGDYINIKGGFFSSIRPNGTVNFWVKPIGGYAQNRAEYIHLVGTVGGSGKNFNVFIYNGKIRFTNDNIPLDGVSTLWKEEWYMITVTWSRQDGRSIFLNGKPENKDNYRNGHRSGDSQSAFVGKFNIYAQGEKIIDEIGFWSRALSESEIQDIYDLDKSAVTRKKK